MLWCGVVFSTILCKRGSHIVEVRLSRGVVVVGRMEKMECKKGMKVEGRMLCYWCILSILGSIILGDEAEERKVGFKR